MTVAVRVIEGRYRIVGEWNALEVANAFLNHLDGRAFSPHTVRAYAFDVVNLARFLLEHELGLMGVRPVDVFAWIDWQGVRRNDRGTTCLLYTSDAADE